MKTLAAIAILFVLLYFGLSYAGFMFAGVGIEIPGWAMKLSPQHPIRGFLMLAAGVLTLAAFIGVLMGRAFSRN